MTIEDRIINLVDVNLGLKATDLTLKLMALDLNLTQNQVIDCIFDLVERGELVEIEMVFPNHVSKSFFVLRGTTINIIRKR